MERVPHTSEDAEKLLRLADLIQQAALTIKSEWAREDFTVPRMPNLGVKKQHSQVHSEDRARDLPSRKLWDAQRIIEAASGALVELVVEPSQRIQQVLSQFLESRALFVTAERRIPDILAEAGDEGVSIQTLAEKTGIEGRKLEVAEDRFSNNRISAALIENPGLRAYVQLLAMGTDKPLFDWLSEKLPPSQIVSDGPGYPGVPDTSNWDISPDSEGLVNRPELGNFALAMVAGGTTSGAAHAYGIMRFFLAVLGFL
ncbi:hypothetical protein Daus18300_012757 [Diaporthe australafricana]|uniref:Uncharacterized protein n=1 Tax=Diaporthe australafricana TaxID=127596 RepID=A0ABR3W1K9_9PEZI